MPRTDRANKAGIKGGVVRYQRGSVAAEGKKRAHRRFLVWRILDHLVRDAGQIRNARGDWHFWIGKGIEGIEDFLFRYCEPEPLTEEGFPIYMLKTKVPNGSCIFLTDGRCSVYPARTRTCRIYPLTVGPGERGRDFEYCLCLDRHQSHFTGSRVSVKDWLYQNFKREDKEYVKREYEIATELGKLMRAIDPAMRPGIVFKVLYYRYYNFDLDQPFQPQYEQNNRHLLADLHRIAGEQ